MKYSPAHTPVEVEVERRVGIVHIHVRDEGIGIEPVALDAICHGVRTARARQLAAGQGIGLRLSRRLAATEGGRRWATSAPGRGSAVHLSLPPAAAGGAAALEPLGTHVDRVWRS